MLSALRREVQAALEELDVRRKPALRRSDNPGALLATDLPQAAERAETERFIARITAMGWRVWTSEGWLLLDKAVPVPEGYAPHLTEGAVGCCISLLRRHAAGEADAGSIRAVVKAAESGRPALERLCEQLHREWAAALREHRNLPGGLLPYLCRADDITR